MTDRHVTVGVDGSLVAVRALDWAAEEAVRRGTALRIVYAVADRDEAGPILASAAARVHERHPGLPVETRAAEGGAVRVGVEVGGAAQPPSCCVGTCPNWPGHLRLSAEVPRPLVPPRPACGSAGVSPGNG
ncbi:hypothetical protein RKD20_001805 [Streptomyces sp. SLBN-8D4]